VLIAPSYGNRASQARFADTLAREVPFAEPPVRDRLAAEELRMLLLLHPGGRARFWGATSRYDSGFDQLAAGDVVLFTGQRRIQAVGRIGCKFRNQPLADLLWRPDPERGSWTNVYTVLDFRQQPDLTYTDVQEAAGYSPGDMFYGTRVVSPDRSAAIISRLLQSLASRPASEPGGPGRDASAAVAEGPARTGQLGWTREEVILAMDFYVTCGAISGGPIPGQHTAEIARLSTLLKTLSAYPPEVQGEKYRNTDGVYLKLMNLRAVQTGGTHGMNRISQTDAAVWRDYIDNLDALHAEAEAIRRRLAEGLLTPAGTTAPTVEDVPIEARNTERFMTTPSGEPREAERAEAALVHRYEGHLAAKGVAVTRKKYRAGQVRPMFCDLWVQDRHALIEAKNSDSRERLRMAIGQLYDYRRFHEPPVRLAVLLPHQPSPDGLALLQSASIEAIWPHGTGFRDSANGTFV
jgi:hypothetical protein